MASTDSTMVPERPIRGHMRRWLLRGAIALLVVVLGLYAYYRHTFPYGASHCCDLLLAQALRDYAANHNGAFPSGGETPEASLSLLCSNADWVTPYLLRGRTVSEAVVREALKRDGRLGPDSCGWHYVEGLRVDDDPGLAILFCRGQTGTYRLGRNVNMRMCETDPFLLTPTN